MAEAIVFGMAGNILSDLSSHAIQKIGSIVGLKKELNKLKNTLSTIDAVLKDADEQQLINNHELKNWVKKIKDACYQVGDVLDDFSTQALRRELRIGDGNFKKVWSFANLSKLVLFHFKMSRRIKEIKQNFDEIVDDRNKFHLATKVVDVGVLNRGREQTHSSVDESKVFGRDGDKNEIINLLSDGDMESVIAIIGMGGMGKTTLAQLVYNDQVVNGIFEVKMWVGVYQDFDVQKILKMIIKSATNNECPDLEMDSLRSRLQDLVRRKKVLLVLDDVWNEDGEKWEKLEFVMSSSARGSKVVVTTRSHKTASVMEAEPYTLKGLSSSDCWNVFERRAFARGKEKADPNLVAIGKEIVAMCQGVPLAAKTLGSSMRLRTTQREWEIVRDNGVWSQPQNENDIMPALRLSYHHLPIHLKQCFMYFASYPLSHNYEKNNLIQSWAAHGFLRSSRGSQSLEDVGNEYLKELTLLSLIQESAKDNNGNILSFKVHDLLHNLARDVAGTEYLHFKEGVTIHNPEEIRYAYFYNCPDSEVKKVICKMRNLRELSLKCALSGSEIFSSLKHLRFLSTCSCPSSISRLQHLRKLFLFNLHTVPESVTSLLNLQTLDLSCCSELRELPKKMGKMINLRHIHLAEDAPILHMPLGFTNLISLRTLGVFFVGNGVGCKLNELHGLVHLEGHLTIRNLENVRDARDCTEVNLKEKERLESLKFSWNDQDGDADARKESMDVLENLQPHSNLKILKIEGYEGSRFARWTMKSLSPKLVEVSIVKCRNIEHIPPFGELPLLRDLLLKDMDALKCIEGRGRYGPREWFPSLKTLTFDSLPNLECLGLEETSQVLSLPSLVELRIIRCPKLEKFPRPPSLERLKVRGCGEKLVRLLLVFPHGKAPTNSLTRLKSLKIEECDDLISLPKNGLVGLVSLEELFIENCSSLVSLDDEALALQSMELLTSLEILNLPSLVSLPRWIQNLTKLQKLVIGYCNGLIDLPDCLWELTSLRDLTIFQCNKLKSLPDGIHHLTALEFLEIGLCSSLISWPNGLAGLESLKELFIWCNLPSLPEQLQQLTGLSYLGISHCRTLLALPEWLLNFTSLQEFYLYRLCFLESLPDWIPDLTALQGLHIDECDQLTSRCQKGTGVDWPKIAHIPNIELNKEWILHA